METMTEIIVSINPVMLTQLATVSKLTVKNNAPMQLNILNLTCQHVISSAINQLLVQQINQLGMQIRALANAIKEMLQVNSLLGMHLLAHMSAIRLLLSNLNLLTNGTHQHVNTFAQRT